MKKKLLTLVLATTTLFGNSQNVAGKIDFEEGGYGSGHTHLLINQEGDTVHNYYFATNYNITFHCGTYDFGTDTWIPDAQDIPLYAEINSSAIAFYNTSNNSSCAGGNITKDFPYKEPDAGCWFITDNDGAIEHSPSDFKIEYDENNLRCTEASGTIYDLDGKASPEGWRVSVFSNNGSGPVLDHTVYLLSRSLNGPSPNWNDCVALGTNGCDMVTSNPNVSWFDTGDGESTWWTVNTNGDPIDYIIISYIGHGSNNLDPATARNVGMALDNFYPCGVSACDFTPEFTVNSDLTVPCTYQFDNMTMFPSINGYEVLKVEWDFGDNTSAEGDQAHHFYSAPGTYEVCMRIWTVYNGECCVDSTCTIVTVDDTQVCDPCSYLSTLGINASGSLPVNFEATGIHPAFEDIVAYYWDFGDGNTGNGSSVSHSYALDGNYTVCLTVLYFDEETNSCCSYEICMSVVATGDGSDHPNNGTGLDDPVGGQDDPPHGFVIPGGNNNVSSDKVTGLSVKQVKVYPNPARDEVNIRLNDQPKAGTKLVITDVSGRQVLTQPVRDIEMIVSTALWQTGVYQVTIISFDKVVSQTQFVKQD